jgi:hypothetical protein
MVTYRDTTTEASGHWYDRTGSQIATVLGAKGQQIKPTLRQARTHDLVPGVTTIIKEAHKEMLVQYRERQVLLASLTLGRKMSETDEDFITRIMRDAKEAAFQAAERGSAIHARIETQLFAYECADEWVLAVRQQLAPIHPEMDSWRCEMPCVHPYGYGTKSDLSLDYPTQWVVDIKTKDGDLSKIDSIYPEHAQQLAATAHALDMPNAQGAILFVSRDIPRAKLVVASDEEMAHGWATFKALLNLWQTRNRYAPSWAKKIYNEA